MKLSELIRELTEIAAHCRPDEEDVVVEVERAHAAVGPAHMVSIKSVSCGFDWEHGKILLHGEEPLFAGLEDLKRAAKFASQVREHMYFRQTLSSKDRNRNSHCLKCIEEHLDQWIPDRGEKKRLTGQ